MPRIQFSDVTPPERRSIRDIPIPKSGKRKVPLTIKPEPQKSPEPETSSVFSNSNFNSKMADLTEKKENGPYEYYYPKEQDHSQNLTGFSKSKKPWIFGVATIAVILIFIVGMMTIFASATINIVPKNQEIEVSTKINVTSGESLTDFVRYEVIKLSETKTVNVPASGEEMAEIKASGKIVIYNNFSTEPQRLIVRTRFESPEGLIYRIPESIIIPGKTVKNGTETPGSIEVEVFADEAGEKYNIKKTDFTIPGFKNDANRYKNFYARSSTGMTGGFIGKRKTVLPADRQNALTSATSEAEANLKKDLETRVPEELVLLSGSILYKSKEITPEENGSSVLVGKEVTAYALLLNKKDLAKKITDEYISPLAEWENIVATVNDFSSVQITNLPSNLETNENMALEINGKTKVLALIDTDSINQKLLGVPKEDAAKLMDEYAGIKSLTATIRPVWKRSFPKNPSKIYVQTTNTE